MEIFVGLGDCECRREDTGELAISFLVRCVLGFFTEFTVKGGEWTGSDDLKDTLYSHNNLPFSNYTTAKFCSQSKCHSIVINACFSQVEMSNSHFLSEGWLSVSWIHALYFISILLAKHDSESFLKYLLSPASCFSVFTKIAFSTYWQKKKFNATWV